MAGKVSDGNSSSVQLVPLSQQAPSAAADASASDPDLVSVMSSKRDALFSF